MEAFAVSYAEGVAKSALGKLGDFLTQEAALVLGVHDDLLSIMDELESITSLLKGLSKVRDPDDQIKVWMKQVREIAYDAEDCVDEFNLVLSDRSSHGVLGLLKRSQFVLKTLSSRRRIAVNVRELRLRAKEVSERRTRYGIGGSAAKAKAADADAIDTDSFSDEDFPAEADSDSDHDDAVASAGKSFVANLLRKASWSLGWKTATVKNGKPPSSYFLREEARLVGIEESKKHLLGHLTGSDDHHTKDELVYAIYGNRGVGKTTLVMQTYRSPEIAERFEVRAWITVPLSFGTGWLLQSLLQQLIPEAPANPEKIMAAEKLQEKIRNHLRHKRYLIVLNDVWVHRSWGEISPCFPRNENGSKIVLTTAVQELARNFKSRYRMKNLSMDKCEEIFWDRYFRGRKNTAKLGFSEPLKQILRKCDMCPLSIIGVADYLTRKTRWKPENWFKLGRSLPPRVEARDILALNYDDLPDRLKRHLLYLSVFPEDYDIRRTRLVRRWMAIRIVTRRDGKSAEKVADENFEELVRRGLIEPTSIDILGKIKKWRIKRLLLEMIGSRSAEENFTCVVREMSPITPNGKIRRLAIHDKSSKELRATHARSLTMFGHVQFDIDIARMRVLRVLDLEDFKNFRNKDFKKICRLTMLIYLGLMGTSITKIHKNIGKLKNLETLDIRETGVETLPDTLSNLTKLIYLLAGSQKRSGMDTSRSIKAVRLLGGVKRMKDLLVLGTIWADLEVLKELRELEKLRKLVLVCDNLSPEQDKELCVSLKLLSNTIHSFQFFQSKNDRVHFMHDLILPLPLLRTIRLSCNLGTLPSWVAKLDDLKELSLGRTKLGRDAVSILQDLPNLVKLVLEPEAFENDKFRPEKEGTFQGLKALHLNNTVAVFHRGSLRNLEFLAVTRDSGFKRFPSVKGLEQLKNLKKIELDPKFSEWKDRKELENTDPEIMALFKDKSKLLVIRSEDSKSG